MLKAAIQTYDKKAKDIGPSLEIKVDTFTVDAYLDLDDKSYSLPSEGQSPLI